MGAGYQVHVLDPADPGVDAELDAFFEDCPESVAQQTGAWRRVICGLGVDEPRALVCRREGELLGVLPAYRTRGPLGSILTTCPQAGPLGGVACRPDADRPAVTAELVAAFRELARADACAVATLISNPFWPDRDLLARLLEPEYELVNVCQVLDLEQDVDDAGGFPRGSANLRRNLRRALSGALHIDEEQTGENVAAWYAIHAARHRELGLEPLPERLFAGALEHVVPAGKGRFFFVRLADSGRMVGGGFYVHHGRVIDALMPSVDGAHTALAPGFLLAHHSISWARARGLRYYNWEPSPPGGGVHRFKRQWGSRDVPYAYLTKVTGDVRPILESSVAEIRAGYPWHYVLPFDRLGAADGGGASSRDAAWSAAEGG